MTRGNMKPPRKCGADTPDSAFFNVHRVNQKNHQVVPVFIKIGTFFLVFVAVGEDLLND